MEGSRWQLASSEMRSTAASQEASHRYPRLRAGSRVGAHRQCRHGRRGSRAGREGAGDAQGGEGQLMRHRLATRPSPEAAEAPPSGGRSRAGGTAPGTTVLEHASMHSIEVLSHHVRQRGGKVTVQRLLVWRALAGDRSHPTAEEIHARLRAQVPTLSLTTVYNILHELVEWGELRRFDIGDGHIHFDPAGEPHAELICLRCHSVIDVPARAEPP